MEKIDKYIYLTICEISVKEMKTTRYSTFNGFCCGIYNSLKNDDLTNKEKSFMFRMMDELALIYSISDERIALYINNFFKLPSETLNTLYSLVNETYIYFPNSFD